MTVRPPADLRGQVAYEAGLLQAQQMANERVRAALNAGQQDLANAFAAFSTDLLVERQISENWRMETIRRQSGPAPERENEQDVHS